MDQGTINSVLREALGRPRFQGTELKSAEPSRPNLSPYSKEQSVPGLLSLIPHILYQIESFFRRNIIENVEKKL
jgi:hypothetical protein